jgi:hypothetical protein
MEEELLSNRDLKKLLKLKVVQLNNKKLLKEKHTLHLLDLRKIIHGQLKNMQDSEEH